MIKETYRQQKERINKLLDSLPKETEEDLNKIYSWKYLRENSIKLLDKPERGAWNVRWCKNCLSFTCHQAEKCQICKAKESGLGNPEIHAKTIKTQIDNGTFNMLNSEVQKNKISNNNLKFKIIEKYYKECREITKFKIILANNAEQCMLCHSKKYGLGNKEIHQKTIDSQIKNGTFNMFNPKIHQKATENRVNNYMSGNLDCFKCGNKKPLNAFGLCSDCITELAIQNRKDKYCEICKDITPHNGRVCLICNPEALGYAKPNFITKNNIRYYKDKELNQLCQDLLSGKENIENYPGFEIRLGKVTYNRIDVLSDEKILFNQNFKIENNIKYYKNEPVLEIIDKLDSGEYSVANFPGWNKRFNKWCYYTEDVITGDIFKLNGPNFINQNNVLYYLDKSTGEYVEWEIYKEKIQKFDIDIDFKMRYNFKQYPTFRIQESENWLGAKQAFEQNLLDNNVDWFVYIKLYINNEGYVKPLVVGKSGSLNVNQTGADVNFSMNIEHGPSRKFLIENDFSWCKTHILILPCESEKQALEIEKEIATEYNLFQS